MEGIPQLSPRSHNELHNGSDPRNKKKEMCDSLSEGPQRHNYIGSQEEKLMEPKVLLETLPIITVKICLCVCMYICVGAVRPKMELRLLLVALSIIIVKVHSYSYLCVYVKAIRPIDGVNTPSSSLAIIVAKLKHNSHLSAENNE